MTQKEHAGYLFTALVMLGIKTDMLTVEMIIKTEDVIRKKEGDFDLYDLASLKAEMTKKIAEAEAEKIQVESQIKASLTPRLQNALKKYFRGANVKHPSKNDLKRMNFSTFSLLDGVGKKSVEELKNFINTL